MARGGRMRLQFHARGEARGRVLLAGQSRPCRPRNRRRCEPEAHPGRGPHGPFTSAGAHDQSRGCYDNGGRPRCATAAALAICRRHGQGPDRGAADPRADSPVPGRQGSREAAQPGRSAAGQARVRPVLANQAGRPASDQPGTPRQWGVSLPGVDRPLPEREYALGRDGHPRASRLHSAIDWLEAASPR